MAFLGRSSSMILVNKNPVAWQPGLSLANLRQQYHPRADVATINGVPATGSWETVQVGDGDSVVIMETGAVLPRAEMDRITAANITPAVFYELKQAVVAVAGLGGLGSTVALTLARAAVGMLIIADYDVVEPANLNRQQYFIDQIGTFKTDATGENIRRINPYIRLRCHCVRLTRQNIPAIFADAAVVAECLDRAEEKQMLVETVLSELPRTVVVSASGLAGYGNSNAIKTTWLSARHILVGDQQTAATPGTGLIAPRVGLAAHHQANAIVEVIVDRLSHKSTGGGNAVT
jgi:sulfur carrier protein ThiS adenylyltransferase